jgi:hypothetical protein
MDQVIVKTITDILLRNPGGGSLAQASSFGGSADFHSPGERGFGPLAVLLEVS